MLNIITVEFSKNILNLNESSLVKIAIEEVFETWEDAYEKDWDQLELITWQNFNLKYY